MEQKNIVNLPMVPLRGLVVFPYMALHFDVGRETSMVAVEHCMVEGEDVFLTAQKDLELEDPGVNDVQRVGTIAKVKQVLKISDNTMRVLVEGYQRGRLVSLSQEKPYLRADVEIFEEGESSPARKYMKEAFVRNIAGQFERYVVLGGRVPPETLFALTDIEDVGKFADLVAANVATQLEDKQRVLDSVDLVDRLTAVLTLLSREIEILEIDKEISKNVRQQIDKSQKEYFLREQIKAIQHELGESEEDLNEIEDLRKRIEETPCRKRHGKLPRKSLLA